MTGGPRRSELLLIPKSTYAYKQTNLENCTLHLRIKVLNEIPDIIVY